MAPKAHVVWLLPPFFLHHPLLCPSSTVLQPHWSSYCTSHNSHCSLRTYLLAMLFLHFLQVFVQILSLQRGLLQPFHIKISPLSPGTLYPFFFFFFITLITTIWFLFNCHFPLPLWECKFHKSHSLWTILGRKSSLVNCRRLANALPLLFRQDWNHPTTLQAVTLPDFAQTISLPLMPRTGRYLSPSISWALDIFWKEHLQWNKLRKASWQLVSKHWRQQSHCHQCSVQISQQVGLHMPCAITGAAWFKLFRLRVWQWVRQAIGAKWQIVFSLLIADSSHILFMHYLLTGKTACSHLRVCPVSLSVLPRSLIPLGKGTVLLCSPHSPAITNELVTSSLKVSLITFLSHQPFINWAFSSLLPQIA